MTRLKVFDSQTKRTYYLNNVDVSCAKLHSYIGKTVENNLILHKPSPYLEYSTDYSYKTDVDKLNALYTHDLSAGFNGYFPSGHGIIISELLPDVLNYITNHINCENLSLTTTTYWCPPVVSRQDKNKNIIQSTRVISFSYIHKELLASLFPAGSVSIFMIYDNLDPSNISEDKLFGMYPINANSEKCYPKYYCPSGAIGVCDTSCNKKCLTNGQGGDSCKDFNQFRDSIMNEQILPSAKSRENNELIIKSWNYNPDSSMSDRGVIKQTDGSWVAQKPNLNSPWGWNDVSLLAQNENIPLLAFGIAIPDMSYSTLTKLSSEIKYSYNELSNNLEPSFNAYRIHKGHELMPYHIGLDISCLTRPDCSNPFFDLSLILHLKS